MINVSLNVLILWTLYIFCFGMATCLIFKLTKIHNTIYALENRLDMFYQNKVFITLMKELKRKDDEITDLETHRKYGV